MIVSRTVESELLSDFLKSNSKALEKFRYYKNRDFSVIKNHLYTKLYYNSDDECVGYGHLDLEDKIWLGIMVADKFVRMGYGEIIIEDLLNQGYQDIYLTVDKDNNPAFNLYKKKNFQILEETENHYLMKKIKK